FDFIEINGANINVVYGLHGIEVFDGASGGGFIGNTVRCTHLHKFKGTSLQIGNALGASIYGNTFEVNCMPTPVSGFTCTAMQMFGQDNYVLTAILNDEGTPAVGIKLEATASRNKFMVKRNNATTPTINSSGGSTNILY
ncbi:MAG: hypothetical protein GY706_03765, partial [Bacteroides sp.]|nr:hypothetical protein [Bacteroides sp.]